MKFLRRPRAARNPAAGMTIVEHLDELRYRLIWIIGSVSVAGIAGWFVFDRVVDLLLRPACPYLKSADGCTLVFTGPLHVFVLRLKVAMFVGLAIAFPIVLFHVWRFVAPGLHSNEKRYAVPFVFFGMLLFGAGIGFAYYTLPQALAFLIGPAISGEFIRPLLTAREFINFMLFYLLAFGVSFEFPLLLMFLAIARVVSSQQMRKYRRHVLVGISVVVAVATPSVDLYTMVVLTVAMYLMYESCIWIARLIKR